MELYVTMSYISIFSFFLGYKHDFIRCIDCTRAAPVAWNSLPDELHMLSNTNTFCKQLKTYLFTSAYTR